jgi:cysteinyl-tRNA synthetase
MLKVYDPILGQIRPFEFEQNTLINMYVCGVTPYDVGHLGHALTYVFFDTVRRYLEFCGYEIHHIQNITDIDDGMIKKSKEKNISIAELTEINHNLYLSEMDSLNVLRPDNFPLSSEFITQMIVKIEQLIKLDFAYVADGHVFFDHSKLSNFGHLIKKNTQSLRQLERTDTMPEEPEHLKRDTLDFLLWQPETFEEASFDSPWSSGRPGWHIECSTMVNEIIGEQVTIHGGGYDLIFPHHECEAAQSQSVTGVEPYCKNWMHVSALNINGKKMSKSLGNLIQVSDLLEKGFSSNTIRMYLLSQHYRSGIEFNEDILHSFSLKNDLLIKAVSEVGGPADQLAVQPLRNSFMDVMDEDFDTSSALEIIFEIADQIVAGKLEHKTAIPTLIELSNVLGITI